jgi:aminopeptidase N
MPLSHRHHARCGHLHAAHAEHAEHASGRPFPFASTARQFERDRPFLVRHIALDLALDVEKKTVAGTATVDVARVDARATELRFDAIGFDLKSVTVEGAPVAYTYDGRTLVVSLAPPLAPPASPDATAASVVIAYAATPRRGLYFLEPDEHYPERPRQVWSQCQEEDARHFVPCHDKPHVKMTTELTVRAPNGWTVLSNGALVRKETPGEGAWLFHWKMSAPHSSYLLTLVAGEFSEIDAKAGELPVSYLVPKGREDDGRRAFGRTPDMIAHFAALTGVAFPWNKYAQVVVSDFIFGGMENTTATTMYEHILLDERAALDVTSDDLVAHELAHQWFGDYVTCRDWSEAWLNEGFATYFEHVWRDKVLGPDEYAYGLKGDLAAYLGEASGRYRRPIVCHEYDAPLDLFDRHLYEKGGLVLHLLWAELGADVFWRGVGAYLKAHAYGLVETRDLQRALEDASGKSLGRMFEQWVHRPGHPEVDVALSWDDGILKVAVKQHQATSDGVPNVFEFPLVLDVAHAGEPARTRLMVTQRAETFAVPCPERPRFVVVDPELQILGEVHVKGSNDMLRAQLHGAPTARGRWLAAQALATTDDPPTIGALVARLEDEREIWCVRAECAEALGSIRAREGFAALARNAATKHPKVRRAVMDALGRFKTPAAVEALRPHALKDDSYLVEAEAARALGKTKQAAAFETLLDVLDRPSWADVVRVGAIDGLAALRDDRGASHVLARTRYGQPNRARRAAILALPKLMADRKGREALEELLDDADPHLRIDAVRALVDLGDARARPALRARLEVDLDARVRRRLREALRDLGGDGKRASDQLRDDFEKLQNEHTELKTRLAVLETRLGRPSAKPESAPKAAKPSRPAERSSSPSPVARAAGQKKAKTTKKTSTKRGKP